MKLDNKLDKRQKNVLVAIAMGLCVIALIVGIRLTVAAYTSNSYLKAVATTNEVEDAFSSDLLLSYRSSEPTEEDYAAQRKSVKVNASNPSFSVNIYNYLVDDKNVVSTKDITYDLEITLAGTSAYSGFSVNGSSFDSNGKLTFSSQKLSANKASTNTYSFKLPEESIGKVSFTVLSKATGGSDTVRYLARRLLPTEDVVSVEPAAKGSFPDATGTNIPSTMAAYNMQISVLGGTKDVKIEWDKAKVAIDPWAKREIASDSSSGTGDQKIENTGSTTIKLKPGIYTVRFYRTGDTEACTKWNELGIQVDGKQVTA